MCISVLWLTVTHSDVDQDDILSSGHIQEDTCLGNLEIGNTEAWGGNTTIFLTEIRIVPDSQIRSSHLEGQPRHCGPWLHEHLEPGAGDMYDCTYLADPGEVRGCFTNTVVIH